MDRKRSLDALRGLASAKLYQCSLNIGLLADAVENESLTKADADRTLTTITELMTLVDRQLEKVVSDQVDVKEEKALERIRKTAGMLRARRGAECVLGHRKCGPGGTLPRAPTTQSWTGLSEVRALLKGTAPT